MITSHREILQHSNLTKILSDHLENLDKEIKGIENLYSKYFNDLTVEALMNKQFTPSKTAQNGLTFVTKDEENNLCKKEQPEEILNVFKIIYTLINEKYDEIPPQKLIENMIINILPKIKVDNLSKNIF